MTTSKNFRVEVPLFILEDEPACAQTDPELFFPLETEYQVQNTATKYSNLAAAKKICAECPLVLQCLEYAVLNNEIGIWGGTTEHERKLLRRRRSYPRKKRGPNIW